MKRSFEDTKPKLDTISKDLYSETVEEPLPPKEELDKVDDTLTQKRLPKDVQWYPIYADQPDTWQADLMFEPYTNSKKEKIGKLPKV